MVFEDLEVLSSSAPPHGASKKVYISKRHGWSSGVDLHAVILHSDEIRACSFSGMRTATVDAP